VEILLYSHHYLSEIEATSKGIMDSWQSEW